MILHTHIRLKVGERVAIGVITDGDGRQHLVSESPYVVLGMASQDDYLAWCQEQNVSRRQTACTTHDGLPCRYFRVSMD